MKDFLHFIVDRCKERSTWLGIVSIVTAVGVVMNSEQQQAIVAVGVAIAGAISAFTKDPA